MMEELAGSRQPHPRFMTKTLMVVDALRQRIIEGELKPGERLQETHIAADLDVSPTPVREALHLLEAEGLVTRLPHKGVQVTELPIGNLKELFMVQGALQSLAVRINLPHLTPDELARARELQDEMVRRKETRQFRDMRSLNYRFHMILCGADRMPWLTRVISGLWMRFPTQVYERIPGLADRTVAEHNRILAAVEAGDLEAAAEAMRRHMETSEKLLAGYQED